GVAPAPPLGVIGQHFQVSAYPLFCLLDRHNCFFMFCHSPGSFLPACRLMMETRAAISPSVSFQYESGPSVGPSPYQAYRLPRRDGPALPFLSVAPGKTYFCSNLSNRLVSSVFARAIFFCDSSMLDWIRSLPMFRFNNSSRFEWTASIRILSSINRSSHSTIWEAGTGITGLSFGVADSLAVAKQSGTALAGTIRKMGYAALSSPCASAPPELSAVHRPLQAETGNRPSLGRIS